MNDDFLQRLRKEPPPGFLADLKGRLDRQPAVPLPSRRRLSFSRGVLLGFLLGGAAFAVTVATVPGAADSLRAFVHRVSQDRTGVGERDDNQHKVVPLGPVWLPEHPGPDTGKGEPGASASAAPVAPVTPTVPAAYPAPVSPGPYVAPRYEHLTFLATWRVLPRVNSAVDHGPGGVVVRPSLETKAFAELCSSFNADLLGVSRRITPQETKLCLQPYIPLAELKVGYQVIALGHLKTYSTPRLSARGLFLALAKRIPDPAHPRQLIDNPNIAWSDVEGSSSYERGHIQVIGPAPDSAPARLAAQLLLEPGCNTYPWIAALRDSDAAAYEDICDRFRDDGAYRKARVPFSISDELVADPTAVGVFSPRELDSNKDIVASPIDGAQPTESSVAGGTYPASRALYVYVKKRAVVGSRLFGDVVRHMILPADLNGHDPLGWGFMTLSAADSSATSNDIQQLTRSPP